MAGLCLFCVFSGLFLGVSRTSALGRVSVRVSPDSTQFLEYLEQVSVSCEGPGARTWTVWRFTKRELSECGSGWGNWSSLVCVLKTLKPQDSGVYWCESRNQSETSQTINITVTGGPVILESPVQVKEGQDLVLSCRSRSGSQDLEADFYRNGSLLKSSPKAQTTLVRFSRDQQGVYSCGFKGLKTSPPTYIYLQEDPPPPVLVLSPDSAQVLEYRSVVLSCVPQSRSEGWTVQRYTMSKSGSGSWSSCGNDWGWAGSGRVCVLNTTKRPDSAIYWCGRNTRRSNSVHLKVFDRGVVLQSPVLPVTEGQNVSLFCLHHTSSSLTARFHRDGHFLSEQPTGHMTIQQVSVSDEGVYQCEIKGELSESSWIQVRPADPAPVPVQSLRLSLLHLRYLVVFSPYMASTFLLVSISRQTENTAPSRRRRRIRRESEGEPEYEDVVPDVTTEYQF